MATKITVVLEDDLDGGPAVETLRFGLGGAEYEIDLNKKNAQTFRKQLAPYIEHARKAGREQRRRSVRTSSSRERSGAVRAWAQDQASRSATAGASQRASLSSTKPPPKDADASLGRSRSGPVPAPMSAGKP